MAIVCLGLTLTLKPNPNRNTPNLNLSRPTDLNRYSGPCLATDTTVLD